MECDWEVELGGDAPVIDAHWENLVDLRFSPGRAQELSEVAALPVLAEILARLNGVGSPVWTAKCDVWPIDTRDPEVFDADEFDAAAESANQGLACYVDLLPGDELLWQSADLVIEWCRAVCKLLNAAPLRCCRADLIVRRAYLARENRTALGVTAYISACGRDQLESAAALGSTLAVFVDTVLAARVPALPASKIQ